MYISLPNLNKRMYIYSKKYCNSILIIQVLNFFFFFYVFRSFTTFINSLKKKKYKQYVVYFIQLRAQCRSPHYVHQNNTFFFFVR